MKRVPIALLVFLSVLNMKYSSAQPGDIKNNMSDFGIIHDYETEGFDRVVDAYDNFVLGMVGNEMPIEEAYEVFFAEQARYIHPPGRIHRLEPDSMFVDNLVVEFIKDELRLPFVYKSHVMLEPECYDNEVGVICKCAYGLNIELERIEKVLELLAESNGFWKDTGLKDRVLASGTLHPVAIASTFNEKFDYNNKIERYLIALSHIERYLNGKFTYNVVRK